MRLAATGEPTWSWGRTWCPILFSTKRTRQPTPSPWPKGKAFVYENSPSQNSQRENSGSFEKVWLQAMHWLISDLLLYLPLDNLVTSGWQILTSLSKPRQPRSCSGSSLEEAATPAMHWCAIMKLMKLTSLADCRNTKKHNMPQAFCNIAQS